MDANGKCNRLLEGQAKKKPALARAFSLSCAAYWWGGGYRIIRRNPHGWPIYVLKFSELPSKLSHIPGGWARGISFNINQRYPDRYGSAQELTGPKASAAACSSLVTATRSLINCSSSKYSPSYSCLLYTS